MDATSLPRSLKKMDRATAATSRQKSCNACVKGKRRCDKRMPRCTRCAVKGLDCVYQKMPPSPSSSSSSSPPQQQQQQQQQQLQSSQVNRESQHHHQQGVCGEANLSEQVQQHQHQHDFDLGFDMDTSPESIHVDPGLDMDFSIIDLMTTTDTHSSSAATSSTSASAGSGLWNLHGFGDGTTTKLDIPPVPIPIMTMPTTPALQLQPHPQQPIRDLSALQSLKGDCFEFNPLDVHDQRTRVGFIVAFVAKMHRTFAAQRCLPFIHRRLYGTNFPRTVLAAYSAAAAYAGCTPENKLWVVRIVNDAARDINREGAAADTPLEKLARVQAALVLDSIRMFDGDIGMRAGSESDMPQLVSWLQELYGVKDELLRQSGRQGSTNSSVARDRDTPPDSWEDWILLECTRRTIMLAVSYVCMVSILKLQEPQCEFFGCDHTFTASRHLWEAKSPTEFFHAWREKPQWKISDLQFEEFWMYARPDDMDDFTKVMLTAQAGPDMVDQFMAGNNTAVF